MAVTAFSNASSPALRSERLRLLLLAIIGVALVGGALYFQIVEKQDPCPLCILQRYAFLAISLFAIAGAAARSWRAVTLAEWLVMVAAAAGAVAAARHVWIQSHPSTACGFDVLEPIVDSLPPAKLLPSVFQVAGLCETTYPPVLGLTLPQWALVCYLLILVPVALTLLRRRLAQRIA